MYHFAFRHLSFSVCISNCPSLLSHLPASFPQLYPRWAGEHLENTYSGPFLNPFFRMGVGEQTKILRSKSTSLVSSTSPTGSKLQGVFICFSETLLPQSYHFCFLTSCHCLTHCQLPLSSHPTGLALPNEQHRTESGPLLPSHFLG